MSFDQVRVPPLPPHARALLDLLARPADAGVLDLRAWETTVRSARSARLLGTLAARVDEAGVAAPLPAPVRDTLRGALLEARYFATMVALEVGALERALAPAGLPWVLLKGAAYLVAGLPLARGRSVRDVDVLVPAARIGEAEDLLVAAGWRADADLDDYDQRYYRLWSHQLPPLRRPGEPLELDVHHTLLPPTGRIRPDAEALLAASVALPGGTRVLAPADQVVHAAVHLFQDPEVDARLRDVVDVDALCRHHAAADAAFWTEVAARASRHGAQRPVAYALAFARAWLRTPVDDAAMAPLAASLRGAGCAWVVRQAAQALPPPDPERGRTGAQRRAGRWLLARALWLRMPPAMLARHAAAKAWRSLVRRSPRAGMAGP